MKSFIIYILFLLSVTELHSQIDENFYDTSCNRWFLNANIGIQISGIKDEDFVSSNLSPLFNVSLGKEITPLFYIQVGYKGFYFKYIDDNYTHNYNFLYIEPVFNITNFFFPLRDNNWNLTMYAGPGIFFNKQLNKTQGCLNSGIQNNFLISDNIKITLDISSIIGWKIYQGDEDILPGITIGITYSFL